MDRLGLQRFYQRISNTSWLALALIFSLAFVLRILVVGLAIGFNKTGYEASDYLALATNLLEGHGMVIHIGEPTAIRPPGYPWFIAGVFAIAGVGNLLALKIAEAIIGALTACLTLLIARRLFGKGVGLLAGLICALYPSQIYFGGTVFTENVFAFWLTLFIYLMLVCADRPTVWLYVLCGIVLGITTLVRPLTLLLPPLILLWGLWVWKSWRRSLLATLVISACMMLTILPWTIRNQIVLGKPVLVSTVGGRTFCGSNNEYVLTHPDEYGNWVKESKLPYYWSMLNGRSELEREQICYKMGMVFWREHLRDLPGLMIAKQANFWSPLPNRDGLTERLLTAGSYGLLLPFMLLGMAWDLRNQRRTLLILLTILVFVANTFIFYGSTRLRAPIEPLLAVYASLGLALCFQFAQQRLSGSVSHERNVSPVS